MALRPEYGELYGAQRDELMEILKMLQERRETSYGARGVSGRAQAETESGDVADLLRKLGIIKGELGVRQLGREQQISDVAGARQYETRQTAAQWAEQKRAATTAFERQKELISLQETMSREREDRAKKDARKSMIRGTLTGLATGGISGLLMPSAVGAAGKPGTAFLRGAAVGAPTVGTSAAYNWMMPQKSQPDFDINEILKRLSPSKSTAGIAKSSPAGYPYT